MDTMTKVKSPTTRLTYVVRNYSDGTLAYRGRFLCNAARALEPGTCYGVGENFIAAEHQCRRQCDAANAQEDA